jgi:hypothetical protein
VDYLQTSFLGTPLYATSRSIPTPVESCADKSPLDGSLGSPCARDWRSGHQASSRARGHAPNLPEEAGGNLNPPFVEWLMGFPIGSTDCWDLGMLRSHYVPPSPGSC